MFKEHIGSDSNLLRMVISNILRNILVNEMGRKSSMLSGLGFFPIGKTIAVFQAVGVHPAWQHDLKYFVKYLRKDSDPTSAFKIEI